MKRLIFVYWKIIFLAIGLIGSASLPAGAASADWADVYARLNPSVPFLSSSGGLCSAAVINQRQVLTAWHCVAALEPVYVLLSEDGPWQKGEVVARDTAADLAVVQTHQPVAATPIPLIPPSQKLRPGESVATIGHPMGIRGGIFRPRLHSQLVRVISAGIVSQIRDGDIVTDMSISPGNSGGPILNNRGEIVGVVSRKLVGTGLGDVGFGGGIDAVRGTVARATPPAGSPAAPALRSVFQAAHQWEFGLDLTSVGSSQAETGVDSALGFSFGARWWSRLVTRIGWLDRGETLQTSAQLGWNQGFLRLPLFRLAGEVGMGWREPFHPSNGKDTFSGYLGLDINGLQVAYHIPFEGERSAAWEISLALVRNVF